jgi:hypothetical protein
LQRGCSSSSSGAGSRLCCGGRCDAGSSSDCCWCLTGVVIGNSISRSKGCCANWFQFAGLVQLVWRCIVGRMLCTVRSVAGPLDFCSGVFWGVQWMTGLVYGWATNLQRIKYACFLVTG